MSFGETVGLVVLVTVFVVALGLMRDQWDRRRSLDDIKMFELIETVEQIKKLEKRADQLEFDLKALGVSKESIEMTLKYNFAPNADVSNPLTR